MDQVKGSHLAHMTGDLDILNVASNPEMLLTTSQQSSIRNYSDYYQMKGFEIFDEIWGLYGEIEACKELYAYFQHLIGVNFSACGSLADLSLSGFLDAFPEVTANEHEWFGGAPGCSGNYAYITVHRKSQARLLNKLADIRDRLEMFVKAGSFADEIQAQFESPKK